MCYYESMKNIRASGPQCIAVKERSSMVTMCHEVLLPRTLELRGPHVQRGKRQKQFRHRDFSGQEGLSKAYP